MSPIEHWWLVLRPDGAAYAVRSTLELAEHYARNMGPDWSVVEVEPLANHQGAVGPYVAEKEIVWLRNQMGDIRGMQSDGATPEEMDHALGRALQGKRARLEFDRKWGL
jgi:hypothetical protein